MVESVILSNALLELDIWDFSSLTTTAKTVNGEYWHVSTNFDWIYVFIQFDLRLWLTCISFMFRTIVDKTMVEWGVVGGEMKVNTWQMKVDICMFPPCWKTFLLLTFSLLTDWLLPFFLFPLGLFSLIFPFS